MQLLKALEAKKVLKKTLAAELKENEACDPEKLTEIRAYKILIMPQTLDGAHSIRLWLPCSVAGQQTAVAVEAANRWTGGCDRLLHVCLHSLTCCTPWPAENVFAMKSWCKNKFGVEESQIDKQFGIPEDMDYI